MKAVPEGHSYPLTGRVAITGVGAVCSLGNSVREILLGLTSGKSGIKEISDFDADGFGCMAAQVKNPPSVKTDVNPQLARSMGKHLSLLLSPTEQALGSAGIGPGTFDPRDMGCFAGMGMVDYHVEDLLPAVVKSLDPSGNLDYDRFFPVGSREIYPLWPLAMLNNVAFCQASIHFGLRGENCVFSPHGDAGIQAVAEAVRVLEEGKAKVALAGGVSEQVSEFSIARARLKGLIPPPGEGPENRAVLGECGAMLVLEPFSAAQERGADILALVGGFGFSCQRDEKGVFASEHAVSSAIRQALVHAGLDPCRIDAIMLSSLNQNELKAVRGIFGTDMESPAMVVTSRALGEMFAAGPILDAAIGLSFEEKTDLAALPGDLLCLPVQRGKRGGGSGIRRVLVNGISYEGRCASMIIETGPGKNR